MPSNHPLFKNSLLHPRLYSLEQVHQFLMAQGVHRWHSAEDLLRDILLQIPRELRDLNLIPVSEVGTPDWAQRLYREEPLFRHGKSA